MHFLGVFPKELQRLPKPQKKELRALNQKKNFTKLPNSKQIEKGKSKKSGNTKLRSRKIPLIESLVEKNLFRKQKQGNLVNKGVLQSQKSNCQKLEKIITKRLDV